METINNRERTTLWSVFCLVFVIMVLFIVEMTTRHKYENSTNTSYIIDRDCSNILLNLSNPYSYINKVTKPFLIELVKNATKSKTF
jgi:hypothetical protein